MDPNTCLEWICAQPDHELRESHAMDLFDWLTGGGFKPTVRPENLKEVCNDPHNMRTTVLVLRFLFPDDFEGSDTWENEWYDDNL